MLMIRCHQKEYAAKLILGVVLFLFIFGIAGTVSAQEMSLFSFGKGKTQVRLYADYFCGPCSNLEPKIEYLVSDLVKRNIITITFIDAPFHKYSSLYAKYFLYILSDKKEIGHALKARAALFEAAKIPIQEEEKLEVFLQKKGFNFKIFDTTPVFAILQNFIREDKLNATPTCVIFDGKKREAFHNGEDILKALEKLK
jgi:thiol-disulfide isomerase/thioredoxin